MASYITFSVRGVYFVLLVLFLSSFRHATTQLQGKWQCDTKSGNLDPTTFYTVNCDGYLLFKPDQTLESTCLDGFFPTGTSWEVSDDRLILKDSDGQAFADFQIKKLEASQMALYRKDVTYVFKRAD